MENETNRNSSFLTLGQAAQHSTASKATIQRAIKNGKLSATKQDGEYRIDPAELQRWESTRKSKKQPETPKVKHSETPLETPDTALMKQEISHLEEKIRMLESTNDELRQDRDDWKGQAKTLLLTNQSSTEEKAPEPPKGFFRRLFD